ncbi:hypothetical protein JCM10207_005655 [Rhodosporidiobolus poonsookiae]
MSAPRKSQISSSAQKRKAEEKDAQPVENSSSVQAPRPPTLKTTGTASYTHVLAVPFEADFSRPACTVDIDLPDIGLPGCCETPTSTASLMSEYVKVDKYDSGGISVWGVSQDKHDLDYNYSGKPPRFGTLKLTFTGKYDLSAKLPTNSAHLLGVARRAGNLSNVPNPHDVCLVFPRSTGNDLRLYTSRGLLSRSSPYFADMFSSDFSEAKPSRPAKRPRPAADEEDMDDSDDETDDHYAAKASSSSTDDVPVGYHIVSVAEACYSTYNALLTFLATGFLQFAPLRSTVLPLNPNAADARQDALLKMGEGRADLPMPPSPKSIYRLADRLQLDELRSIALDQIKSSLVVDTAALELANPTALRYDEVSQVVVEFVTKNLAAVEKTAAYKTLMDEIERGDKPEAAPVLVKLLKARTR